MNHFGAPTPCFKARLKFGCSRNWLAAIANKMALPLGAIAATVAILLATTVESAPQKYQREYSPPTAAILAWGQPSRVAVVDRTHVNSRFCSSDDNEIDVGDDSWTPAAFRAFHEMRAGRPQSPSNQCIEEYDDGDNGEGPFRGIGRRLDALLPWLALCGHCFVWRFGKPCPSPS